MSQVSNNIIEIREVVVKFDDQVVLNHLSLDIHKGEILALVGGSGCGKTTLLRTLLMLNPHEQGTIRIFGTDLKKLDGSGLAALQKRWGVMFQHNALFSSLNVLENVCFPLKEFTDLNQASQEELAQLRITQVGLPPTAAWKYPAELSGGMQKRVALARAIVLEPELVFLDEPTAGLDPNSADALEDLIVRLQQALHLTIVIITHDLDTLWRIPTRVAYMGQGKVMAVEKMSDLVENGNEMIRSYFQSVRGQWRIDYFKRYTNSKGM